MSAIPLPEEDSLRSDRPADLNSAVANAPWPRWLVEMCRQPVTLLALAAAAAFISGLTVAPQGLIVGGVILGLIVLGLVWPWISLAGVSATLEPAAGRTSEGELAPWRLKIVNRWPFPVWGLSLRGDLTGVLAATPVVARLDAVAPWSEEEFVLEATPECRGVYPGANPAIASGFPFGLCTASRVVECEQTLVVWPRRYPLAGAPFPAARGGDQVALRETRAGGDGDRIGTRAWRPGDSLRSVHWSLTARLDRLIVSERQAARRASVVVEVDARAAIHRGRGAGGSLAHALRAGASIVESLWEQGAEVTLVLAGERFVGTRRDGLATLWNAMARLPVDGVSEEADGPRLGAVPGTGLSIVVTTDLGLASRVAPLGKDCRAIVLHAAGFDAAAAAAVPEGQSVCTGAWLSIAGPNRFAEQFTKGWERVCHDAWRG